MHPQNPHISISTTVLPGHVQTPNIQVPEIAAVTKVTMMDSMSSDDEESDADASDTSERQARQTKQLKAKRANRTRLGRKSMTYKSEKEQTKAIEAVRKSLGDAMIKHIQKNCKTVRERRPLLALVALDHKRKDVNNALAIYTNSFEWRLCQIHAKYPGPIKPVRKPLI
jgi:hypothetical protein